MYKVIYHYDNNNSEELKTTYKSRTDAWRDVLKLGPALLTGLNLVEVVEVKPVYYVIAVTKHDGRFIHGVWHSLEEAKESIKNATIEEWFNLTIAAELLPPLA